MAFGVFTDLVANLQLLDAKANALAHCDFDDPVLPSPCPAVSAGRWRAPVAVLSGSIVERDQLQTHLAHQATHDSLTGICNRPAAITGIQAAMHRAARTGATTALLFVDLNEFKAVNDSHGHEVGDEVLRQVAARMTVDLRSGDFVARLGGDEFVVVAEGIAGVADATDLARRIIDTISQPIEVGGLRISIGAAVGIAMTLDGPEEPLRLLARADAAMYRAKHHERSAIEIFDADLQQQMIEREDIETAPHRRAGRPGRRGDSSCTTSRFSTRRQARWSAPKRSSVGTGPAMGCSPRLVHPHRRGDRAHHRCRLLGPHRSDPPARRMVGRRRARRASRGRQHLRPAPAQPPAPRPHPSGARPDRHRPAPPQHRDHRDRPAHRPRRGRRRELDAVRALGVRVAIDDFGTGYTSLAHLQQLPIDTIKIDRSFISQLNVRRGSSLVRMVTDLGHAIDINIVAEGVETGEEMTALQAMGADHLQGFLLSRPLEAAAFSTWAHEPTGAEGPTQATPPGHPPPPVEQGRFPSSPRGYLRARRTGAPTPGHGHHLAPHNQHDPLLPSPRPILPTKTEETPSRPRTPPPPPLTTSPSGSRSPLYRRLGPPPLPS